MRSVLGRRSPAMTTPPRAHIAAAQQIAEDSFDIDISLEVGDVFD
jgi:hypothetical protein